VGTALARQTTFLAIATVVVGAALANLALAIATLLIAIGRAVVIVATLVVAALAVATLLTATVLVGAASGLRNAAVHLLTVVEALGALRALAPPLIALAGAALGELTARRARPSALGSPGVLMPRRHQGAAEGEAGQAAQHATAGATGGEDLGESVKAGSVHSVILAMVGISRAHFAH
jgi:hypothetical protein